MLHRQAISRISQNKGIKHTTSSPYYPQSNGLAEACVKVVKNMMKKAQKCKVRFNDMMYQNRTSPVAGKRESPIELLEQRRLRTNMPHLGKRNPRGDPKAKTHKLPHRHKSYVSRRSRSRLNTSRHMVSSQNHEPPRGTQIISARKQLQQDSETHRTAHTPVLHSTTTTS